MDILYFTLISIGVYFGADWLLDRLERKRGKRFENRQVIFFLIILPLALLSFWVMRNLM
jgi:hypothetical protein